jgi:hypothetical protein
LMNKSQLNFFPLNQYTHKLIQKRNLLLPYLYYKNQDNIKIGE